MSQSPYTPFYLIICLVLSLGFAYVEVAWLKRSLGLSGAWLSIGAVAVVNFFLILFGILALVVNSYWVYLFFPIPFAPIAFVVVKVLLYFMIQKATSAEMQAPWLVAIVVTVAGGLICGAVLSAAASINPTYQNLYQAISQQEDAKLKTMLRFAVAHEPMMTDLINTALDANNVVAIDALTGQRPNPDLQYNYGRSGSDAAWQLVKWQLDNARTVNAINAIDETLSYFSVDKLNYGLDKGVDPKNFPGFLHKIIRGYEVRVPKTPLSREEVEALTNKLTLLLEHGADINSTDEFGYEAISVLFTLNVPVEPVLRVVIDRGAHINTQTPQPINIASSYFLPKGTSPLMEATVIGDAASVKLLMDKGADRELKNSEGKSAVDYARLSGGSK